MEILIQNDVVEQVEYNVEVTWTRHVCVGMLSAMRVVTIRPLKCQVRDDMCMMLFTKNDIIEEAWLIGHDIVCKIILGRVKSDTT